MSLMQKVSTRKLRLSWLNFCKEKENVIKNPKNRYNKKAASKILLAAFCVISILKKVMFDK